MTSLVSRDDVEDQLYNLAGPHKAALCPKVMRVIDAYTITVSRKMGGVDWTPETHKYLRPGEVDEGSGKRRCVTCGKVKDLNKEFAFDSRVPYGRRRSCLICSPNKHLVREYLCPKCKERLPISKFGLKKKQHPNRTYKCLVCENS
jgi:hypothetical protein